MVQSIAEKTHIEESKVREVLKEIGTSKVFEMRSEADIRELIEQISKRLDIATDLIRKVIIAVAVAHHIEPATEITSSDFIRKIAQQTHIPEENVQKITQEPEIQEVITQRERELAEEERIKQISKRIDITKEQINTIIKESEKDITAQDTPVVSPFTIREVSEKTQISQEEVEKVLERVPTVTNIPQEQQAGAISEKTGIAPNKVKRILDETPPDQLPKAPVQPAPAVSIEEYEEIRTMWMNHYRNSEIPKSERISSRKEWIEEDTRNLTNTINLLISTSEKDRQQGMQKVGDLLPFLLLGGFTDIETLTYIKAKLEAAKLVIDEEQKIDQAKKDANKDLEEMVIIPAVEPREEQKADELAQALEMPVPEETSGLPGFSNEPGTSETDDELDVQLPFRNIKTVPDKKK